MQAYFHRKIYKWLCCVERSIYLHLICTAICVAFFICSHITLMHVDISFQNFKRHSVIGTIYHRSVCKMQRSLLSILNGITLQLNFDCNGTCLHLKKKCSANECNSVWTSDRECVHEQVITVLCTFLFFTFSLWLKIMDDLQNDST